MSDNDEMEEIPPHKDCASKGVYLLQGGAVILAVAAILRPLDGPLGDIASWGAVSARAGSMAF